MSYGTKKGLYALLGVREYVVFDPLKEYLEPRQRLYRLAGEEFLPVANRLTLETVGLEAESVEDRLRLRNPATGELLPTAVERAERAEERAQRLAARLREVGLEE